MTTIELTSDQEIFVIAEKRERRRRVLVIDDDVALLRMLRLLLRYRGFDVTTTSNPADALSEAIRGRPEVIVLDLAMPRIDGWTLYRRPRPHPLRVRRAFCTAKTRCGRLAREAIRGR